MKFYYENVLASQNITAKPNVAWVADITTIDLKFKKLNVYLCIDIHTNTVIAYLLRSEAIKSRDITKVLTQAIDKRFLTCPRTKLIIHTDRGTQFSSKEYKNFFNKFQDFCEPSMSRENTPTDNAVAERFMKTFKEHRLNCQTIQEWLLDSFSQNPDFRNSRSVLNKFVKSLNNTQNKKSTLMPPERHDKRSSVASLLMREPKHPKAFSKHFGYDYRLDDVNEFKSQNQEVVSILTEIAAKKAELVDNTPFDNFEDNLAIKIIDKCLQEIYNLISKNPQLTRKYVEEAIEPIEESLEELHAKANMLLPKQKKKREIQPLRDLLNANLFPVFLANSGNCYVYQKDLKSSQLRIAYTILYHAGLRLNEIRNLTEESLLNAIESSQLNIIHYKTKQSFIHVFSKRGVKELKNLNCEFDIVFKKYKYKYLFGKEKPVHKKALIQIINKDLKYTSQLAGLPYNIKSHSFRINVISNLLKITSVQNTLEIIGHRDIRSTMSYRRYALSPLKPAYFRLTLIEGNLVSQEQRSQESKTFDYDYRSKDSKKKK